MPVTNWEYAHDRAIRLTPNGTLFEQGRLYEFVYNAKDPLVAHDAYRARVITWNLVGIAPGAIAPAFKSE